MRRFGRLVLVVLAAIGGTVLLLAGFGVYALFQERPEPLPGHMLLTLNLDAGVTEASPEDPFARFRLGKTYALRHLVEGLDRAAGDARVTGLLVKLDHSHLNMAQAQELRDAIAGFRKSGKPAVVFSHSLGEFGAATIEYYLASAFGTIWVQPSGDVGLTGFATESPFLLDLMDTLGIKAQFGARWEYKSAIEPLTRKDYSPEARQSLDALLSSWRQQVVAGVAEARKLSPEQVQALIDRSPLTAAEAQAAGLVDKLGYWEEVTEPLEKDGAKRVDLEDYQTKAETALAGAPKLALIYGVGPVQLGDDERSLFAEGEVMAADATARAIRDAVADKEVRAIVFRIDSPGGSYVASDTIWHEVKRARAAGKPVVVSMGGTAASGGYFVGMGAEKIVAQPGTITGSIGVFAGKMVLAEMWKKLGVNWGEIHQGANATMWSANSEFSPEAWTRLNTMLDRVYQDFTAKAAEGRGLSVDAMDHLARGRVWSGADAQRNGLVDVLGGLTTATGLAKQAAGIPAAQAVRLTPFPKAKRPLDFLLEAMDKGHLETAWRAMGDLVRVLALTRPLVRDFEAYGPEAGTLRAPEIRQ